jgi:hypothetical protein
MNGDVVCHLTIRKCSRVFRSMALIEEAEDQFVAERAANEQHGLPLFVLKMNCNEARRQCCAYNTRSHRQPVLPAPLRESGAADRKDAFDAIGNPIQHNKTMLDCSGELRAAWRQKDR